MKAFERRTQVSSEAFVHSRLISAALTLAFVALDAAPALAQPREPTHVACVGDSITAGTGASSTATNYPSDLGKLFGSGVKVQNFGHSGATMLASGNTPYVEQPEYTAATTFVSGAGANAVVDVIIMLGTNDSKPVNWDASDGNSNAGMFGVDCGALIDHFSTLPTHPAVYLALPLTAFNNTYTISGSTIKDQIIPALQQIATGRKIATIDLNSPTAGHPEYFTDGVHPNDAGYEIVAQTMQNGLLRVPQVALTAPLDGASFMGAVNVTADASGGNVPITSVQFLQGATVFGSATLAPFSATLGGVAPGSYTLSARATDNTGAAATSAAVRITVAADDDAGSSGEGGVDGAAPPTAGGMGAGASGAAGSGARDSGAGGAIPGSAGTAGVSATAGAGAGTGGASSSPHGSDITNGCGCRIAVKRGAPRGPLLPLLVLCALGLRRARRQRWE
jgi:acyl-CoA thioesterase-1